MALRDARSTTAGHPKPSKPSVRRPRRLCSSGGHREDVKNVVLTQDYESGELGAEQVAPAACCSRENPTARTATGMYLCVLCHSIFALKLEFLFFKRSGKSEK